MLHVPFITLYCTSYKWHAWTCLRTEVLIKCLDNISLNFKSYIFRCTDLFQQCVLSNNVLWHFFKYISESLYFSALSKMLITYSLWILYDTPCIFLLKMRNFVLNVKHGKLPIFCPTRMIRGLNATPSWNIVFNEWLSPVSEAPYTVERKA